MTLLQIMGQSHKGWVLKIAKVKLENKTTNFGISCPLLTKNTIYKKNSREVTEPLKKIKRRINNLWENVLNSYIQPSNLSVLHQKRNFCWLAFCIGPTLKLLIFVRILYFYIIQIRVRVVHKLCWQDFNIFWPPI